MIQSILLPLSGKNGEGKHATVDAKFYDQLSKESWHLNKGGYVKNGKRGLMHRYVVQLRGDEIEGFIVDHINGDRSDNRSCNLRVTTSKGNAKNKHNDPVFDKLVGVRYSKNVYQTVHKNVVYYENQDCRLCALCYDSIVYHCYGPGKRLNDNTSDTTLPISYWKLSEDLLSQLEKIRSSYTDHKGVKKVKDGWKASVVVDLGVFKTQEEAAMAYNNAIMVLKKEPKFEHFNHF
jgi:NAD-dependent dihydropyrimidine dehydrogenase PreA subunit